MAQDKTAGLPTALLEQGHDVHAEEGLLVLIYLVAVGGRCHDVRHTGLRLRQIRRKVHLLPPELFLAFYAWKSEFGTEPCAFYEIDGSI